MATSAQQTERVYQRITDRLNSNGYSLKPDRIYKVIYREDNRFRSETVGAPTEVRYVKVESDENFDNE